MAQTAETGSDRIKMDGAWTLVDLHRFFSLYSQLYAFHYSFEQSEYADEYDDELDYWVKAPYIVNPWVGGYDAVNFYKQLESRVPGRHRPTLLSMRYASPGWMDFGLAIGVAISIKVAVAFSINTMQRLNQLYGEIYKGMRERDLMKINVKRRELELAREKIQFVEDCTEKLSRLLKFEHKQGIDASTSNPLTTLRILLSYYRKIKKLNKYETEGKTEI